MAASVTATVSVDGCAPDCDACSDRFSLGRVTWIVTTASWVLSGSVGAFVDWALNAKVTVLSGSLRMFHTAKMVNSVPPTTVPVLRTVTKLSQTEEEPSLMSGDPLSNVSLGGDPTSRHRSTDH